MHPPTKPAWMDWLSALWPVFMVIAGIVGGHMNKVRQRSEAERAADVARDSEIEKLKLGAEGHDARIARLETRFDNWRQ